MILVHNMNHLGGVFLLLTISCLYHGIIAQGPVFSATSGTPVKPNARNNNWNQQNQNWGGPQPPPNQNWLQGQQQPQNNWGKPQIPPQQNWNQNPPPQQQQQNWAQNPQQQNWNQNQQPPPPQQQPQNNWNQNPPQQQQQQNWNPGAQPPQNQPNPTGQANNWAPPPNNNQNAHWAQRPDQQNQVTGKQGEWNPAMNNLGRPVNTGGQIQETKIGIPVNQPKNAWQSGNNQQPQAGQQPPPASNAPLGPPRGGNWVEIKPGSQQGMGPSTATQNTAYPTQTPAPAPGYQTTPVTGYPQQMQGQQQQPQQNQQQFQQPQQPQPPQGYPRSRMSANQRNWAPRTPRPQPTTPQPTTTTLSIWDLLNTTPFPGNKPGTCPDPQVAKRECSKHCRRDQDCLDIRKCCHANFYNGTGCCTVVNAPTDWMMGFFMNPAMGFFTK